jgi:LuxR family maltose regulon positive regulatory protein
MDQSLLATKLIAPPEHPALVPRPHLLRQLNAGLHRRLSLISAPAGFGKTTLLSEWIHSQPGPSRGIAWLSLEESDNDPVRFLNYTAAALQSINPAIGRSAQAILQAAQHPPLEVVLTALVNDITATPHPLILILDDYHVIHTLPIHQQLAFLLDHQPPHMHLVVATREDPPVPLARLRARGQVMEIRQVDLAFSPHEAADFLSRVMDIELSEVDTLALHERTEGWIAGLQLAALSMRGRADLHEMVMSFAGSNRYVLDYLIEEVFQQQTAEIQDFLLKTAILDRLTASLCDAVAGRDDSRHILQALEQANLFILPLDQSRQWYRYHRLFVDLLRHRLRLDGMEELAPDLHSRASRWYADAGLHTDAVHHALRGSDWDRAADLILSAAPSLLSRGETATFIAWLRQLPDEVVRSRPRLCYEASWPLVLTGEYAAAESYLDQVEGTPGMPPNILVGLIAARAFIARAQGDYHQTIGLSSQALAHLPPDAPELRCILAVNLGIAYWNVAELSKAAEAFTEAEEAASKVENHHARLTARAFLALIRGAQGNLRQAATLCRETIALGEDLPATALTRTALAALHYEWNELETAARYAERGIELSQRSGNPEIQTVGYRVLARIRQAQGKREAAQAALDAADRVAKAKDILPIVHIRNAAARLQIALMENDPATADRLAEHITNSDAPFLFYPHLGLLHTHLQLEQGRLTTAAQSLSDWHERILAAGWHYGVIEVRALQALAASTQTEALTFLAEALALAETEGYVRTFVDKGAAMADLLRKAAARGIASGYASRLLNTFPHPAIARGDSRLFDLLSEREIEVLQSLASGQTNQEIADSLCISVNTTKTHLKNIYAKLEVGNRREAVRRARELGFL